MTDKPKGVTEVELAPEVDIDGRPTSSAWRWIGAEFRKELPTRSVQGRGGNYAYLTARQVADRLDQVVGPGNWADAYRVLTTEPWVIECTLTVFGVAKVNVGYSNSPDAEPTDRNYEIEPAKAAFSDAFKRAATGWGIGRWLQKGTPV